MGRTSLVWLGHAAAAAALLALAWVRWNDPAMSRPFELDEWLTVRYYTWVGVEPTGEHRDVPHISDFRSAPPPGLQHLAIGGYCGFGRWPEPNNHVLNSLLVNLSVAAERSERAARLPALAGAAAFAAAVYALCVLLGWRLAAPVAGLAAWLLPYPEAYSVTCRGYTWVLALQAVSVALAYRMARTTRPLVAGAACVVITAATLVTVVSLTVDWVLPYFLALLLVRPTAGEAEENPPADAEWRRYVLAVALATAAVAAVFLGSRLPSVYSSARQYGVPFGSVGDLTDRATTTVTFLFPDCWTQALAAAGVVGLCALARDRRHRWLAVFVGLFAAVNVLHFAAARSLPPPRACGYLLLPLLLGAAYLFELVARAYASPWSRAAAVGLGVAACAPPAVAPVAPPPEAAHLRELLALAGKTSVPAESAVFVRVQTGMDYLVGLYGPAEWRRVSAVRPGVELSVLSTSQEIVGKGQTEAGLTEKACRLVRHTGRTAPFPADGDVPAGAWVFWYPDFLSLGLDGGAVIGHVQESGAAAAVLHARHQVKLDVQSFPSCCLVMPRADADAALITRVVRTGLERFGGRAVVFVPAAADEQKAIFRTRLPRGGE